jgi:hypothetical protein
MGRDIRIPKTVASDDLHDKLERLIAKMKLKDRRDITKPNLCVELLESHPKLKSL